MYIKMGENSQVFTKLCSIQPEIYQVRCSSRPKRGSRSLRLDIHAVPSDLMADVI